MTASLFGKTYSDFASIDKNQKLSIYTFQKHCPAVVSAMVLPMNLIDAYAEN